MAVRLDGLGVDSVLLEQQLCMAIPGGSQDSLSATFRGLSKPQITQGGKTISFLTSSQIPGTAGSAALLQAVILMFRELFSLQNLPVCVFCVLSAMANRARLLFFIKHICLPVLDLGSVNENVAELNPHRIRRGAVQAKGKIKKNVLALVLKDSRARTTLCL